MLKQVQKTILDKKLLMPGDSVLVALSGGADSVCLLDCLLKLAKEFSVTVSAAHVHHGLRGEEADCDEAFVQKLCQEKDVPFYVKHVNVKELALQTGATVEEAGRHARYGFFAELAEQYRFTKIATAHNADDNAETVLMHFLRGASVAGLSGIPYQNGIVIRPLLDVWREEIERYNHENGLVFQTDSTNIDTVYTRNRIRHDLLPKIKKEYNPGFAKMIVHNAQLMRECQSFLSAEIDTRFEVEATPVFGGFSFDLDRLRKEHPYMMKSLIRRALTLLVPAKEIGGAMSDAICALIKEAKGMRCVVGDVTATVYNGNLYIRHEISLKPFSYPLVCGESTKVAETGDEFVCTVRKEPVDEHALFACFDAEMLEGKQLFVRSRHAGDYFYPEGMEGKKSIKEFFVDKKIPRFLRERIPIITADEDVIWIAGYRVERRYRKKKTTKQFLCVELMRGENNDSNGK